MANRGISRVFGESSLERKCRWWFGVALGVLLFLSFYWSGQQLRDIVEQSGQEIAPELVKSAWVEPHFKFATEIDLTSLSEEEQRSWDKIMQELLQSADDFGKEFEAYAILPPNPKNANPPQNPYEEYQLKRFMAAKPGELEPIDHPLDDMFRHYAPIYAKAACLTCHHVYGKAPRPGLAEGDLMALMRVQVERGQTTNRIDMSQGMMWGVAVTIGMLSMFLLWFIVKLLIVKPVQHLRDVANAVREGDTNQRADIQTGDEFEELAAAFNRMVRQLLSQQSTLESVNGELDAKVDELAQMNLQLFEMNRLKSDFLATMSHELRTPLNSILGFSDVLGTVDTLDAKQQRYVNNIQRSGKMLLDMINDILDLAKMESGRMDASPSEFSLAAVVTAQCDMARPLAERKNIDLDAALPEDAPPLRQDQPKLQQILNNLLSNAIKFTPEGGRIMVRARSEKASVPHNYDGGSQLGVLPALGSHGDARTLVLEVEDTGIGISDADQAVIFEKFRQGASAAPRGDAMTREQGGTGLGLSIVRELCRLLGGDVSVRSVSGKGSTFVVRLPWRLPDRTDLDAELNRGVAELTRPTTPQLPSPPAAAAS